MPFLRPKSKLARQGTDKAPLAPGTQRIDLSAAQEQPDRFEVIESCHSTWLFDSVDRRFCRVLRANTEPPTVATDWRPYDHLVVEDGTDAFIVFLDPSGARLLRSWRHGQHCEHCGGDHTAELSLEDLRKVARA